MQRIIDPTASSSLPAAPTLTGTTGYFVEGVPGVSVPTRLRGWWVNMLQEELMSVLTAAGITPDTTGTNFSQLLTAIRSFNRTRLTAATTWYVSTTGNDTTGTGASGLPFATPQGAWNRAAATLDLGGYTLTLSIGGGTFSGISGAGFTASGILPGQASPVALIGAGIGTTILTSTVAGSSSITSTDGWISLASMTVQSGVSSGSTGGSCLLARETGLILVGSNLAFGAVPSYGAHIAANTAGRVEITSAYTIQGGGGYHMSAGTNSLIFMNLGGGGVSVSGTPAFSSQFASATNCSVIQIQSSSFFGSATGSRYAVATNSVINTYGGGASFFPGSTAGTVDSTGAYA